jgi:hypothetical protein
MKRIEDRSAKETSDWSTRTMLTRIRCAAPDLKENQSGGNARWVKSDFFATASRISD